MPLDKVVGSHSKSPGTSRVLTPGRSDPSSLKPVNAIFRRKNAYRVFCLRQITPSEASPVPCLKERFHHTTTLAVEDYSPEIDCKRLIPGDIFCPKNGKKFGNQFYLRRFSRVTLLRNSVHRCTHRQLRTFRRQPRR